MPSGCLEDRNPWAGEGEHVESLVIGVNKVLSWVLRRC